MQLEESDYLAVAHKNSLSHVLSLNENLRDEIGKLREEQKKLKRQPQLPNHPVIDKLIKRMKMERSVVNYTVQYFTAICFRFRPCRPTNTITAASNILTTHAGA